MESYNAHLKPKKKAAWDPNLFSRAVGKEGARWGHRGRSPQLGLTATHLEWLQYLDQEGGPTQEAQGWDM